LRRQEVLRAVLANDTASEGELDSDHIDHDEDRAVQDAADSDVSDDKVYMSQSTNSDDDADDNFYTSFSLSHGQTKIFHFWTVTIWRWDYF